jgi:hypothetical protein
VSEATPPVPATVRVAALAVALHAALALAQASGASVGVVPGDRTRALAAGVGMLATAWGLWRGFAWSWWLAIATGGLLLVMWGAALYLVSRLSGDRPTFPAATPVGALGAAILLAAIVLLLLPRSRAAFRARSA